MPEQYDLVVVGGGPGGYVAAIRAAQLGFNTALVEREQLGGICLNWGCIPTKALLKGADVAHTLNTMSDWGFSADNQQFDLQQLVRHSRSVASRLSKGIELLLTKHAVTVIKGQATVSDKCTLSVTTNDNTVTIKTPHIVLATGARANVLSGLVPDGKFIWGAREAMTPKVLPARLLIVGAGAIGMEFASLYNDLGSQVTVVEAMASILPAEDSEISAHAEKAFRDRGIVIQTDTVIETANAQDDQLYITLKSGNNITELIADRIIVAVGVSANIDNLGLEALKVNTEQGFIKTDEFCRSNVVGLYAIGDVAGPPWLAHKASHEALICIDSISGETGIKPLNKERIPACTYCRPQLASVGLTESAAKKRGLDIRVGRFNLQASGKALAINEAQGMVKTIFSATTGELLGAHMIGPEVTEQIQGLVVAINAEVTETELIDTVFPHPTVSESIHESILDAMNRAIHQ